MKNLYTLASLLCAWLVIPANAQLIISSTGVPVTENFSTFTGSGFDANPTVGQLDSDTWRVNGMSDGVMVFGDTKTGGDFGQGPSTGGVTTAGVYAFNTGITNGNMLGVQPTGGDFTPGTITVKITNNSSEAITALQINYDIIYLNNATRANDLNLAYSTDDVSYSNISSLNFTTPEADDANDWTVDNKSFLLSGINVAIGADIFIQWQSDDNAGTGSRDEFGIDNVSFTSVATGQNPILSFQDAILNVNEGQTSFDLVVEIDGAYPSQTTVDVVLNGGTATNSNDFVFVSPTTVIFTANDTSSKTVTVVLNDDANDEGEENILFQLQNPTNNGILANEHVEVIITDDDKFIPNYTIDEINDVDGNGSADSLGVYCRLNGLVYGVNLRSSGLQFFFNDGTGGIQVFDLVYDFGYSVTNGDSLRVIGTVNQFNGQLQFSPDSIVLLEQGVNLNQPDVISALSEINEGDYVQVNCVQLVDINDWNSGSGNGFTISVNNGDTDFEVRVDDMSELFNEAGPDFTFNIRGMVGQFDNSDPKDEGYQIYPMFTGHVADTLSASFTYEAFGDSVDFTSTSIGATISSWSFGDGSPLSNETSPYHIYESDGGYSVLLTIQNTFGCANNYNETIEIITDEIMELEELSFQMFPTLVSNEIHIVCNSHEGRKLSIYNVLGELVQEKQIVGKETVLNVEHLEPNVYFSTVCKGKNCVTQKWIKK